MTYILLVNQRNHYMHAVGQQEQQLKTACHAAQTTCLLLSARQPVSRPKLNFFTRTASVVRHRKITMSLAQPVTGSWPAANPRSHRSQRPIQCCLVSASRSPVGVRRTRGGGGLVRQLCGAKSAPHLGTNVLRLRWQGVGGRGNKYQVRGPPWSLLRARLRAAKPVPKHPKPYRTFISH
jgi:hypothetical protein